MALNLVLTDTSAAQTALSRTGKVNRVGLCVRKIG